MRSRHGCHVRGNPGAPRVLVSGTGRAGTTFIMRVLTVLGVDTGFGREEALAGPVSAGGLETCPRGPEDFAGLPFVFKDPQLCIHARRLLAEGLALCQAIVPVRDAREVAVSRVRRGLLWIPDPGEPDVHWPQRYHTCGEEELVGLQEAHCRAALAELVLSLCDAGVRTRLVPFSDVGDAGRLYMHLVDSIPGDWTSRSNFIDAHTEVAASGGL